MAPQAFMLLPLISACFFLALYAVRKIRQRNGHRLPPGPNRIPYFGNIFNAPRGQGRQWAKLKDLFGPISSIVVFSQPFIILNDLAAASELLDKNSLKTSDRPRYVFGGELCGLNDALPLLQYGDHYRRTRKQLHQFIGARSSLERHIPAQEFETRRLLLNILETPNDFLVHTQSMVGAMLLKLAYGYTVQRGGEDPLVKLSYSAFVRVWTSIQPGAWAVDSLPILKSVPGWIPGMGFQKTAKEWEALFIDAITKPFEFVEKRLADGKAVPSFASTNLSDVKNEEEKTKLKWASSALYVAGLDTISSAISTFILAMLAHPYVLERAQYEIDTVIGMRLPTSEDRPELPYIDMIVSEVLRLNVANQLCPAHASSEEVSFRGYHIPKGSVIVANNWQFAHDPQYYSNPWEFNPERFSHMDGREPELDPRTYVFGFGRRSCPGKELADSLVFNIISAIIVVFNIRKAKDQWGRDIEITSNPQNPILSYNKAKDFKCSITPRSEKALDFIKSIQSMIL